jgi:hypothetical protein
MRTHFQNATKWKEYHTAIDKLVEKYQDLWEQSDKSQGTKAHLLGLCQNEWADIRYQTVEDFNKQLEDYNKAYFKDRNKDLLLLSVKEKEIETRYAGMTDGELKAEVSSFENQAVVDPFRTAAFSKELKSRSSMRKDHAAFRDLVKRLRLDDPGAQIGRDIVEAVERLNSTDNDTCLCFHDGQGVSGHSLDEMIFTEKGNNKNERYQDQFQT